MDSRQAAVMVLAAIALLPVAANAISLSVQGPVNGTLNNNGTVFLGNVGPGESFYVSASASTTNASGSYVNIGWDRFVAVSLPSGWSAQSSTLYENPMKLKITASPYAQDGVYNLKLRAVNLQNYSGLGNITINAVVNVTPDVFRLSVSPSTVSTGVNQPADLGVVINNTGISDDPFLINVAGLPAWNQSEEVIALHSSSSTFSYPVYFDEPGQYMFNITVTSETSPLVTRSYPIVLNVRPSVLNDYYATGQGVVISPVIVEPAYGFMLLLSDAYHWLTGS